MYHWKLFTARNVLSRALSNSICGPGRVLWDVFPVAESSETVTRAEQLKLNFAQAVLALELNGPQGHWKIDWR